MNNLLIRLKSFTLFELIIALTVSSIVISGVFVMLNITNRFLLNYQELNKSLNDVLLFSGSLDNDCFKARNIRDLTRSEIEIQGIDESIVYSFSAGHIVRSNGFSTDTFRIKVLDVDFEKRTEKNSYLDCLRLNVGIHGDTVPLLFMVKKTNRQIVEQTY